MSLKIKNLFFLSLILLGIFSCSGNKGSKSDTPSWYINSRENDGENLYGVASRFSLEDATKAALSDAASRLLVSISSESASLKEENRFDINEENRQKIKQSIEKIDFTGFRTSRSEKIGANYFVEVQIEKDPFVKNQKEKITFLEKKIFDLKTNLNNLNLIQKRTSLQKMVNLSKELELSSRILNSLGENINLKEKLNNLANLENQLNSINDKIEFYFDINSAKEISNLLRNALNKEQIAIAKSRSNDANQVVIKIESSKITNKIYGAYITKLHLDFENIVNNKAIASNSLEVSGSSAISENESYKSSIKSLEEKIAKEGILKIIGISN
ncbi:MAG: LPP20 family lipoprotein [Rickettsiales bacterium]|nr:LPP20 family lipoprotein [Rickettsiales bacterium]